MKTVILGSTVLALAILILPLQAQDYEAEARSALEEYFRAWNAADNASIVKISNFPRVSLGGNGQVVVRDGHEEIEIDFGLLRQAEGWDHTTLDLVEATQVSEDKVHFRIVSSRRRADGSPYRTVPALYVFTKQNGHWGLQLQSILSATFAETS